MPEMRRKIISFVSIVAFFLIHDKRGGGGVWLGAKGEESTDNEIKTRPNKVASKKTTTKTKEGSLPGIRNGFVANRSTASAAQ